LLGFIPGEEFPPGNTCQNPIILLGSRSIIPALGRRTDYIAPILFDGIIVEEHIRRKFSRSK
jgi:hypothetical protein